MEKYPGGIGTVNFNEDVLYAQWKALAYYIGVKYNMVSNKGQDKPPICYGEIFKLCIVLNKLYSCIILKNN